MFWRTITLLHAKLQRAQSDHETLKELIENIPDWEWAKTSDPYKWITKAHEEYKNERKSNSWYNEFLSAPPQEAQTRFGMDTIKRELAKVDGLEEKADKLLKHMATLRSMHSAMEKQMQGKTPCQSNEPQKKNTRC